MEAPAAVAAPAAPVAERIAERITSKRERIHINTGAICNNNCVFCMEEDREGRYVNNSAITPEVVRSILETNRGAEEVCFTSGEPTTNPRLFDFVAWAKSLDYRRISIMTNGRMLSHAPYLHRLVRAGMNLFYISIHGHTAPLHEGLTRTPKSFLQTVAGLDRVAALARDGVTLHTSTVVTKRNLPHVGDIYRFLRSHGVHQVVFNVMQANGRANTFFDQIFPPYQEIAATFRTFIAEASRHEKQPMAFFVDIPLCTTEGIPDFNRGYVEASVHYGTRDEAIALWGNVPAERLVGDDGRLVQITRKDLDDARREKRAECRSCRYDAVCEGVWANYLKRYGWDDFVPVRA